MSWQTSNSSYGYRNSQMVSKFKGSRPQGLINLGNTCYISSVLQILFPILDESNFPISKFKQILTNLFFKLKKTKDSRIYKQFKEVAQKEIQIIQGWDQQDSHEFLIGFLDQLNRQNTKDLNKGTPVIAYKPDQTVRKNWTNFTQQMKKIQYSPIIQLFYGDSLSTFTCPQGHQKHIFERYQQLSLTFSESQTKSTYSPYSYSFSYQNHQTTSLKQMILHQFSQSQVTDLYCENCKRKHKFKKEIKLYTLPHYLIIHLTRFKRGYYSSEKVSNYVKFDEQLKLKEGSTNKMINFNLIGIVNHYGSINRGHYTSQVKLNDIWWQADDQIVRQSRIDSLNNESKYIYMLFYEQN